MADRVVKVRLLAQVSDYEAGMLRASRATRTVGTEAEKLEQKRQAFDSFGRGLMVTGAALAGATVLSVKAAAQWESAWAGVTKTVEGTPAELSKVEDGLRGLTAVLPASHEEIAAVAEAAGQLGIKTGSVVQFTRTMIDLGETTNLSASEAATSLARFVNIMGTSQDEVSNLGSALVGLGNNYATTEAEIMEMAMRLAGAGKQIGLSEGQVLGLSTALSSVGIEAEAGGSAMSKVMIDIAASVETGDEKLAKFAATAGMSSEQFSKLWRQDSAAALAAFVKGLAGAESQGKSTLGILADLGITEVRMRDALLRSSAAADQFAGAMRMGNVEFDKNNALTDEAAKRYATVESKLRMAGNAVRDAAIEFGEQFLPMVGAAAEGVSDFAGMLGDLPDPVQGLVGLLTGTAGAIGLAGGAALLAVPKFAEFKVGMEVLTGTTFSTRGALRSMWRFLTGPWGIALVAGAIAVNELQAAQERLKTSTEEFQNVIRNAKSVGDLFDASDAAVYSVLDEAIKDAETFVQKLDMIATNPFATGFDLSAQQLRASLKNIGEELAVTAQTDLPAAQRAFALLVDEMGLQGDQVEQLLSVMDPYKKALQEQATQNGINVTTLGEAKNAQNLMNLAMGETPAAAAEADAALTEIEEAAQDADEALSGAKEALQGIADTAMTMGDATDQALGSINAMTEAAEAEGVTLNGTNDASIRFRDSLRDVEQAHRDSAVAILENGGTLAEARAEWEKGRQKVIDMRVAKGQDRAEATKWADANLGSASQVVSAFGDVSSAINSVPKHPVIRLTAHTSEAYNALMNLQRVLRSVTGNKSLHVSTGQGGQGGLVAGNAAGGLYVDGVKEFAGGGFEPGIYDYRPGGIHKFAEEYDEAYISMNPARRQRSEQVWVQAGRRMGFMSDGQSAPVVTPQVYVQNPFTGEYLLAQVASVAQGEIGSYDAARERTSRRGVRV